MTKKVFSIFETKEDAQSAISKLKHHGFQAVDISVKGKSTYESYLTNRYHVGICKTAIFEDKINQGATLVAVNTKSHNEREVRIIMNDYDALETMTVADEMTNDYRHPHMVFVRR